MRSLWHSFLALFSSQKPDIDWRKKTAEFERKLQAHYALKNDHATFPHDLWMPVKFLTREINKLGRAGFDKEAGQVFKILEADCKSILKSNQLAISSYDTKLLSLYNTINDDLMTLLHNNEAIDEIAAKQAVEQLYLAFEREKPDTILFLTSDFLANETPVLSHGSDMRTHFIADKMRQYLQAGRNSRKPIDLIRIERQLGDRPFSTLNLEWLEVFRYFAQIFPEKYPSIEAPYYVTGQEDESAFLSLIPLLKKLGIPFPIPKKMHQPLQLHQNALYQCFKACGLVICFDKTAIVVGRPLVMTFNKQHQLHNMNGPALMFNDHVPYYFIEGERVDEPLVMEKEHLSVEAILKMESSIIRDRIIEALGPEQFKTKFNAVLIEQTDVGILWKAELSDRSEAQAFIENSPPETLTEEEREAFMQQLNSSVESLGALEIIGTQPETITGAFHIISPYCRTVEAAIQEVYESQNPLPF